MAVFVSICSHFHAFHILHYQHQHRLNSNSTQITHSKFLRFPFDRIHCYYRYYIYILLVKHINKSEKNIYIRITNEKCHDTYDRLIDGGKREIFDTIFNYTMSDQSETHYAIEKELKERETRCAEYREQRTGKRIREHKT